MPGHRSLVSALLLLGVVAACGGKVDDGFETPTPSTSPDPSLDSADGGSVAIDADGAPGAISPTPGTTPAPASACDAPALTCGDAFPGAVPFSASTANDLVGVWLYCAGPQATSTGSGYQGGFEFAADGDLLPDRPGRRRHLPPRPRSLVDLELEGQGRRQRRARASRGRDRRDRRHPLQRLRSRHLPAKPGGQRHDRLAGALSAHTPTTRVGRFDSLFAPLKGMAYWPEKQAWQKSPASAGCFAWPGSMTPRSMPSSER